VTQCKYNLQKCCSNNQAEQITILKVLEQLPKLDDPTGRIVAIFTDSKVTIDSLKNHSMHSFLIQEIRNKVRHLSTLNWTIHFGWVKAHIGIEGNEAAHDENDQNYSIRQGSGNNCGHRNKQSRPQKMAEPMKQHRERSSVPIVLTTGGAESKNEEPFTPEFIAIITGHGKTKSYLHKLKLADNPTCPCNEGVQTPEHIIYLCKILESQRSSLIRHITARGGNRPPTNDELVANYLNAFLRFNKSIDFQKLM